MSRSRPKKRVRVPAVVHHKASGRNVVFLRDESGRRKMVYLRGAAGSAEEQRHYQKLISDYLAGCPVKSTPARPLASEYPTVGQLVAAWLLFADRYYRDPSGRPTGEVESSRYALSELLRLFRDTHTDLITITDLLTVRQAMIDWRGAKPSSRVSRLCRNTINSRMYRVKRLFRWGVEQRLVPGSTWHELSALRGLSKGRLGVPDNPPVEAVPWGMVKPILAELTPTVRDAILVQWYTGMRPAEVLGMTRRQIMDMSGNSWLYRPERHKTTWKGNDRIIAIGPMAQDVLQPRLPLAPDAALFSPRDSWREFREAKRNLRKTSPTKQMRDRDARTANEMAKKEFFDVAVYRRAIHRACDRAGVPKWSPHQLRHAVGVRLATEVGIEAARASLGHSDLKTTRRYAMGSDAMIAAKVMGSHG